LLYALKAPGLKAGGAFAAVSRESSLLANNLLMTVGAATVLLGTLYPLIADGLQLGKVSVGAPFFNAVFLPLMTPMILLMALAPFLSWKRADMGVVLKRFWLVIVMACVVFAVMYGMVADDIPTFVAAGGVAVAVWLAVGTILELVMRLRPHKAGVWRRMQGLPRSAYGMSAAHLGMAFLIIGMCGGLWAQEYVGTMQPGARHAFAGYTLRFDGVKDIQGPNYMARTGHFAVFADGAEITQLTPEQRRYTTPPMPTTEAAIHSTGWADLYIAIGEDTDNGTVVRFYFKPFVPFLWYGAGLMVCGGMLSLSDRRRRVGAPAKRTRSPAAPAATQPTA
jgi:cytochrome c-type biogenesis protein CcmF